MESQLNSIFEDANSSFCLKVIHGFGCIILSDSDLQTSLRFSLVFVIKKSGLIAGFSTINVCFSSFSK